MKRRMVRLWTCVLGWSLVLTMGACNYGPSMNDSSSPALQDDPASLKIVDTSPADEADGVAVDAVISATFSVAPNQETVNSSTFIVEDQDGAVVPGTFEFTGATVRFVQETALAYETWYAITLVNIEDQEGNLLEEEFFWIFRTGIAPDTTPPSALVSPADGTFGAPTNSIIAVTFSEPVARLSVNGQSFTVHDSADNVVAGEIFHSEDDSSAIFVPAGELLQEMTYSATLTDGIADLAGNSLVATTWSFTTGQDRDSEAPTVDLDTSTLGPDSVGVDAGNLVIVFSEPINPLTITADSFMVTDAAGNRIPGRFVIEGSKVTFIPTEPLAFKTVYYITLTSDIEDLAGNALLEMSWSFTTGWGIVGVTPLPMPQRAPTDSTISVTCSEAIDPVSVNGTTMIVTAKGKKKGPVAGAISLSGNTIVFTPDKPLAKNNGYDVILSADLADLDGILLGKEYRWSFRTGK